jgi:pyridoxine kinase
VPDQRILTIQDISCVGQCSLTVALPILSACGVETCILPSAVLSTHTAAGFNGYTFRDLTEDIPGIHQHWQRENIRFDAIYTGYLGSVKQIDYVKAILETMGKPEGKRIVDPAMADNGVLYSGFDLPYVSEMRRLCAMADLILPNITEACLLTEVPYQTKYDPAYTARLLEKLDEMGMKTVVLTGVSYAPETTGVIVHQNGRSSYYEHRKIAKNCHGTGDVYASTFVGAWVTGHNIYEAAKIAADYTLRCIEATQGDESHWYGVKFEKVLPELIQMMQKTNKLS